MIFFFPLQQEKVEVEEYRYRVATGQYDLPIESTSEPKKIKYKKDTYFSDEEDLDDD